jgi:hypothetical protein
MSTTIVSYNGVDYTNSVDDLFKLLLKYEKQELHQNQCKCDIGDEVSFIHTGCEAFAAKIMRKILNSTDKDTQQQVLDRYKEKYGEEPDVDLLMVFS